MAYSTRRHPQNVDRQWLPWRLTGCPTRIARKRRRRQSPLGQTEKNSVRAYVFRFGLELGHCSTQSACLKRARLGLSIMPEIPLSAGQLVSFIASGNNRSAKLVVEQRRDILRRDGLTEQIALSLSTSIGFEICQLTGVFHTLSSGC